MEIIKDIISFAGFYLFIYLGSILVTYGKYKALELWNRRHDGMKVCSACFEFFNKSKSPSDNE